MIININDLKETWSIEESRNKSHTTGKKRIYILDEVGECVGASCTKCGTLYMEIKEHFVKCTGRKYDLNAKCKHCSSGYYKENSEEIREQSAKWKAEHPEHCKEYKTAYNIRNRERMSVYNHSHHIKTYPQRRERKIAVQKIYKSKFPEKHIAWGHTRRTKKKGNGGSYTQAQLKECLKFFNNCCAYTGEQLDKYHVDHVKPVVKGGTSFIYNLVPSKSYANQSKGAKELESWYREQPYFSEERLNKIYEWQKIAFNKYAKEKVC